MVLDSYMFCMCLCCSKEIIQILAIFLMPTVPIQDLLCNFGRQGTKKRRKKADKEAAKAENGGSSIKSYMFALAFSV